METGHTSTEQAQPSYTTQIFDRAVKSGCCLDAVFSPYLPLTSAGHIHVSIPSPCGHRCHPIPQAKCQLKGGEKQEGKKKNGVWRKAEEWGTEEEIGEGRRGSPFQREGTGGGSKVEKKRGGFTYPYRWPAFHLVHR